MTGYLRRNPLIAALALGTAVLAALLLMELAVFRLEPEPVATKRAAAADAKLLPPVPQVAPEQAYAETTTRPLFVPTRRPAPELAQAAQPAFVRGRFTLQGVIVAGDNRTAMLREKATGRVHRVETGKEIDGIKIVQIDPTVVTLGVGDEREIVPLSVQRPGAQVAGAPPAAPGAPPPAAFAAQGPFGATAAPGAPVVPGAPQPLTAAGSPFPARTMTPQPPVQPPGAPPPTAAATPAPAPPGGPVTTPAPPMSPEELMARRRARRAQQDQ